MGRPHLGLKARHDTTPENAQNRCRSTFPWSHRMIHEASGAEIRTKRSVSSSRFQHIQDHLISTPYEGDIAETVQGVLAESEMNVKTELESTCNLEMRPVHVCPVWRCPHQRGPMRKSQRMAEAAGFQEKEKARSFLREAMINSLRRPLQVSL